MCRGSLKDYSETLYLCSRCGFCRFVCPVLFEENMKEVISPRGRVILSIGLVCGEIKPTARLARRLYACLGCRNCRTKCPPDIEIDEIIEQARYELIRAGIRLPELRDVYNNLREEGNPFGYSRSKRFEWLK